MNGAGASKCVGCVLCTHADWLVAMNSLGASTVVQVDHPAVAAGQLKLSYGTGRTYGGLDRFGRVAGQPWTSADGATVHDHFRYGYDRASNRRWRENVPASAKDEYYTYDGLHRLTQAERGDLAGTYPNYTGISGTEKRQEDFGLDALGN